MKRVREFLLTTLIGGVVVVLPIVIMVWVGKLIIQLITAAVSPVSNLINLEVSELLINTIALVLIIGVCFIIGLFIRTRIGGAIYGYIEKQWLEKIPVYSSIRDIVQQFSGQKKQPFTKVVIVKPFENGAEMTGFVTDDEGDYVTVFVPTAPNPTNGFVFHMRPEDITYVKIRTEDAMRTVVGMGVGSYELFDKLESKDEAE